MNTRALLAGFLLASLPAWANVAPAAHDDWEEVNHDELVTVFRKEVEGSDVLAVKGIGTLNAPIGKVLGVVLDAANRPEWMEQVKSVEVVREISPTERIEYFVLSPPWPLRDRDLVVRETVEVDRAAHTVTIHMKSVEDATKPVRGDRIRAELYDATFVATPVDGGAKTAMVAESHADPKGSIPKWIVNIYQKDMPSKTLRRMLERISKVAVAESPWAREVALNAGPAAAGGAKPVTAGAAGVPAGAAAAAETAGER